MQPASDARSGAMNAAALPIAESESKVGKKWVVAVLVPILVPIIGIVSLTIEHYLQRIREAAIAERVGAEKRESFCRAATHRLVEIDKMLKKTTDTDVLLQWTEYDWRNLDDKLAELHEQYLDANTGSVREMLMNYSEYVGEKWRGSKYAECPELRRREYYDESRRLFSEAQAALTNYRDASVSYRGSEAAPVTYASRLQVLSVPPPR